VNVIRYAEHNLHNRYEIILVENGSSDETYAIAKEMTRIYSPVRAFQIPERSKAAAVCYGMRMARGEYRYMCDCDLSAPIGELTKFMKAMELGGWDVVIGSREHVDSHVETSFKRWFIGRVWQVVVDLFTGLDYPDTQCGFKLFNAHAANDIFPRVQCTSMAFDVEVLYLAKQLGYYVSELPVTWHNDPDSRVRLFHDIRLMLKDVAQIKRLHHAVKPGYKEITA
jgi:glycosyltransferase involved in cell wall biosynthesis